MTTINDLNENAVETGTGVSDETIVLGIPGTIKEEDIQQQEQEEVPVRIVKPSQQKRVEADMSDLPQREVTGVDFRESKVDDILGDGTGGIFAKVLKEKEEEVQELYEAIDAHNEQVAIALGEEVPEEIDDEVVAESAAKLKNVVLKSDENFEDALDSRFDEEEYVDEVEKELEEDSETVEITPTEGPKIVAKSIEEVSKDIDPVISSIGETVKSSNVGVNVSFDIDDEELEDEVEKEDNEDENLEEIRNNITAKIAPVSKRLNISGFTISKKPVNVSTALEGIERKTADWALPSTNTHFGMIEFSGTEVQSIGDANGLNRYEAMAKRYKIFYDHLIGENKPSSVESMVKSISYFDDDHLYMGVYIANFAGSNYIPYDCPNQKCKHTFLSEDIPIESMYKFDKESDKKKFMEILNGQFNQISDLYTTEAIPISEKFAIGFKEPSIYNIVFEPSIIDEKFATKYRDIISVLGYVDEIYAIDYENQQIAPLSYKRYPNNKLKDIKSRIITYAKVFKALSPDEYNIVLAYISSINNKNTSISYILPETVCPKCGRVIPEQVVTAQQLLFMRHQLAALATTSIK